MLQHDMVAVLRHAGRSPVTQHHYCREMRWFLQWLGHDRPLRVRRPEVVAYLRTDTVEAITSSTADGVWRR